jgi:hypothetical protein
MARRRCIMNGIPDPYEITARVIVGGVMVVIVDRAPNGEDWRYIGARADLVGHQIHFSHHEASPVQSVAETTAVRNLLSRAGVDPARFAQEVARIQAENIEPERTPLQELLSVIEEVARTHPIVRQAWTIFKEETA